MPYFQFQCECGEEYEVLTNYDKANKYIFAEETKRQGNDLVTVKTAIVCPKCGSEKKERLPSSISGIIFKNPVGTDKWRSHDYRFYHNLPNVLKERERAEIAEKSKKAYNDINDLDGNNFGEVK